MKKLLHLQLLPLLSGVQNFSLHLLEGLDREEFDIYVACRPGGEFVEAIQERGYKYIPLKCLNHPISLLDLFAFLELLFVFKRYRFDIVHTNSSKTGLLGRIAASICKVPLILHTVHGTSFQEGQSFLKKTFFKAMERLGNKFCHKVVFVNNSDRLNCIKLGLVAEEKAVTIYNAIPEQQARMLAEIASARVFDTERTDFVVGSTLRFTEQKNVVNLIGAACQACKREPRLRFILLGDGEDLSLCKQIVQTHGLNERVLLPGWDTDIGKWLTLFDAFILYSRWEAQPFSIIEGMSAGLPVIGSQIPSIMEIVDDNSGYLIVLDDHKFLINCLVDLPGNAETVFEKGRYAARQISALCDYRQMVATYVRIYNGEVALELES